MAAAALLTLPPAPGGVRALAPCPPRLPHPPRVDRRRARDRSSGRRAQVAGHARRRVRRHGHQRPPGGAPSSIIFGRSNGSKVPNSGLALVIRGAQERLGPTLMTTFGTAVAFVPFVALGNVAGLEIARPMAIFVLGGLVTSTLISLFVLPKLYLGSGPRQVPTQRRFWPKQPSGLQPHHRIGAPDAAHRES